MKENKHISKDRILFEFIPGLAIWSVLIFWGYFIFSSPNPKITYISPTTANQISDKPTKKLASNNSKKASTNQKTKPNRVKTVLEVPPKKQKFTVSTQLLYPKKGAQIIGGKIDFRWKSSLKDFSYFKVILISPNKKERTLATTRKQSFSWAFDEPHNASGYKWKILTISKKNGKPKTTSSETSSFFYKIIKKKKAKSKPIKKEPRVAVKKTPSKKKQSRLQKQDPEDLQNDKLNGKAAYVSDKK